MKDLFPSRRKKPKIKLLCSFHGKFLHRPPSGKLRYTGGETRIISVERSISFFRLKSKVLELICCPNKYTHSFSLQYQISDSEIAEEHSALVLIASDDNVRCMIDAYERLEFHGKHYKLWIFVCNDDDNENEYANLQKLEDIRFKKFDETQSLSCELGVGCNNNEIVGAKNRIHVKSGIVSFCEDDFVKNNSLAYYCGGQLGCDKVRKLVTSGHIVKSNEDSLRKVVLKQKMLAKQSPLSQSFGDGLGLAIEQAAMGIASFDDEYCGKPGVSLSSEREAPLTCDSAYPSFLVSSYRSNAIDYKYNDDKFIDSRSCVYSVPSSVSHSHPLNPKDGNSGVGINAQKNNNFDSRYSIGVLPRPKPYSIMGCYDAMFETRSVEPGTFSNFNRENIMPRAVGSVTSTAGLAPLSYSNQLLGGLSTSSASYDNSYHGIRNYCFGQGDARNQRIYHHSRSHYSNFTEAGNHRNVRVDGRPWVGKFYPGIQSSPVISKQAQVVKSSHPAMLKSWSGSHNQQVEGDLQASDCILNNPTCSLSFPYGSEENLTEHSDLGLPQDIKPEPESQLSYHGPLTGMADQSHFALTDSKNFPGCTEDVNARIDFLSSCFPNQHDATNYQGPNRPESECNAKISKADAICKSFSKHETGTQKLQDNIAPSIDLPLHNLSRLLLDDLKTSTHSTSSSSSSRRETYVKLQPMALELMDEEHLGSSPHFQISPDKAMELHEENEQEAVIQRDVESALSIVEKEEIQKACNGSKVHGEIPTELATVYNHLATRELQTIKNSDLEYIKELGSGTYGTVFYGKWKGSDVAIKRLKPSCFNGGAVLENRLIADVWKEAYILGQLRHPNIVALYGVVTDGPATNLATVTEFMVNGSLKQVFRRKDRTIDRRKRLILAMGAAFGMEYLHEKNIVHFDLKSHNLLVNMKDPQRPVCKIGDLGLSKIKQKTLVFGGVRGTIPWMAPELLSCQNLVTEKVDVYSFGIIMWELLTGEKPYAKMRSHEIIAGIIKGTLRPEIPSWCDPAWRSLMEKCWSADVDNRPAFSEIAKELRIMAAAMNIK